MDKLTTTKPTTTTDAAAATGIWWWFDRPGMQLSMALGFDETPAETH